MDEVDMVTKRKNRPKDSFQNELQSKLRQRKSLGLTAEVTDSEEDTVSSPRNMDFMKTRAARPSSAKRRAHQSPNLSQGLGTTTMRARDLSSLLGRDDDYDEDEEIIAANLGKTSGSGGRLPSPGMKTPSPKMESGYLRKTPTLSGSPKEQTGKLDSIFGRKTPTKDSSPRTGQLSKEDIIFGRKTPSDDRKSPSDGSKNRLPGMDGDKSWQPPSFRTASPGLSEHSRGSRGVTPVDGTLDTISETPREKLSGRSSLGQKPEASPRQLALMGERPKPHARSRTGDSKTPPLVDSRRKSPSSPSENQGLLKRSTPTLDLFGSGNRESAAEKVHGYIDLDKKEQSESKTRDGRKTLDGKARGASPSGRFTRDGRKTPTERASELNRKTPTGRKTPNELQKKSSLAKTPSEEEKKTQQQQSTGSTLLDFLTESSKPTPQERKKKPQQSMDDDLDGLLEANRRALNERKSSELRKSAEGHRSPGLKGRSAPPTRPKSLMTSGLEEQTTSLTYKQQSAEDTSSLCDDIPPDPNRKVAQEEAKAGGKQRSERVQAENAIDMVTSAQTMQYIRPAKKIRPVTADAKVQHRPKPRYGLLPGQKPSLEERNFNSTSDIRDAIYEEWYKERIRQGRQKKKEEEEKKKIQEKKEREEKEQQRIHAETSYASWLENKKKQKQIEKSEEHTKKDKEKEKEEQDEIEHEKESGSYEAWRKNKIAKIREETKKKAEAERVKKEKEEKEKKKKIEERATLHSEWVEKKNKELAIEKMKRKEKKKTQKEIEEETENKLTQKQRKSEELYYEWLAKKEEHDKIEKKRAKKRQMMEESKPAFFPASRTIPFGR